MNKIKQYKSVKEAISKGQTMVNVPVFIFMFGTPFLFVFTVVHFTSMEYASIAILLGILLGFILAWTWWSFTIVKWRIWTLENTQQKNWSALNRKAVDKKLIWKEGHLFEKTEFRSQKEQRKIEKFYQKIKEESLEEENLSIDNIEDDPSVPSQIQYHFDRSTLIFETVSNIFLLSLGIFLLAIQEFGVGILLTGAMLFAFDYKAIKNINNRKPQLQISEEGIEIDFLKYGLVKWADAQDLTVDTDEEMLSLIIWKDEDPFEITYSLKQLELKDYDEFLRIVNVFMKRAYLNGLLTIDKK